MLRQCCRELDPDTNNEVTALCRFLALRHTEVRIPFLERWAGRAGAADLELLAVDGLDGSAPAGKRFFEVDIDGVPDVVAFSFEEWMWFLKHNVSIRKLVEWVTGLTSFTMKCKSWVPPST